MLKSLKLFAAITLLMNASASYAVDILVLGLFGNMAIIKIDDKQRKLKIGDTSPEGIKLVSVDSAEAVLEFKNKRETYRLGSHSSFGVHDSSDSNKNGKPQIATIHQFDSMFRTTGSINKIPVTFMVDTGASMVAMSADTARKIGLNYRYKGRPGMASTASGTARIYKVSLDRIKVGDIILRNIEGAVIEGNYSGEVLLGRSFLKHCKMVTENERLILMKK